MFWMCCGREVQELGLKVEGCSVVGAAVTPRLSKL